MYQFISVQSFSPVRLFVISWTAAHQASLSITNSWSLLKLKSIKFSDAIHQWGVSDLILCHPFSSCLQSFLAPESSPVSQFFASGGQNIRVSASVLPTNIQDWFPLGFTGLISLQSKGLSRVFSNTTASVLRCSAFYIVQHSHPYMTTGKTIALTRQTFVGNVMSLLFNMLSRLVIIFLPRSKCLLISWLQSPSAVILEPPKIKSYTVSTVSPSISHEVMGSDAMILVFWMLSFKPTFHSPLSLSSRGFWVPLHFLP